MLDEVLERVASIAEELTELRHSEKLLEGRFAGTERELAALIATAVPVGERVTQLTVIAARLEGAVEHLPDKSPASPAPAPRSMP